MNPLSDYSLVTFQLTNSAVGVGVLALPFCLRKCGVVLGLLVLSVCGYLTRASCRLILISCQKRKASTFPSCVRQALGAWVRGFLELANASFLFGSLVAFHNVAANLTIQLTLGTADLDKFAMHSAIFFFATVIGLPLSLCADVSMLGRLSLVAFCSYAVLLIHLAFTALPNLLNPNVFIRLTYWQPEGILFVLPVFSSALLLQPQLCVITDDLSRHVSSLLGAATTAILSCFIFYTLVATFGYLSYQDNLRGDVLLCLGTGLSNWLVRFAFLVSLAVSYPLMVYPCYSSLISLFEHLTRGFNDALPLNNKHRRPVTMGKCLTTAAIVYLSAVCAALAPNIEFIIGLSGCLTGSTLGYIVPGLVGLMTIDSGDRYNRYEAILCTLFGLSLMLLSSWAVLKSDGDPVIVASTEPLNTFTYPVEAIANATEAVLTEVGNATKTVVAEIAL